VEKALSVPSQPCVPPAKLNLQTPPKGHNVKTRPAKVDDKLKTSNFDGTGSRGFPALTRPILQFACC
jgi:hypothetical protein